VVLPLQSGGGDLTVEIRDVVAGAPGGRVLGGGTLDEAGYSTGTGTSFVAVPLGNPPLVTANAAYAIVLHAPREQAVQVRGVVGAAYVDGAFFASNTADAAWLRPPVVPNGTWRSKRTWAARSRRWVVGVSASPRRATPSG
jgi:hypothetical protein